MDVARGRAALTQSAQAMGKPGVEPERAEGPPKPRGRAALLDKLRAMQEQHPVGTVPAAETPKMPGETVVPIPRGRAALIKSLQAMVISKPGEEAEKAAEPPKPKGRAALLSKLRAVQEPSSVGSGDRPQKHSTEVTPEVAKEKPEQSVCSFRGSSGDPVYMTANYVRLALQEDRGFFEYEVRFEPEVDSKPFRIKMLNSQLAALGGVKMFDGGSVLYLPVELAEARTAAAVPHPGDGTAVTMTVAFRRNRRMSECVHLYNVLFKRVMSALQYSRVGKNYFNTASPFAIPQHRLEVLPGYAVAVEEYEGGLMVCCDSQHRVLRTDTALDLMREAKLGVKEKYQEYIQSALIGAVVLTKYNNKTYIIDDILWKVTPMDTFQTSKGTTATFVDYYKTVYGITIVDKNQPMLLHMQKVRTNTAAGVEERCIMLVPELCNLTGLTEELKSNFRVMKDVAQYTRITPQQRVEAMRRYQKNIAESPQAQKILGDWGLSLAATSIDLEARILKPETIIFGDNVTVQNDARADWTKACVRHKAVSPVDLLSWAVVFTRKDSEAAHEFVESSRALSNTIGMTISAPTMHCVENDKTSSYATKCQQLVVKDYQMIVFIFPTLRDDLYSSVKKVCCLQRPLPTQCIISRTLRNQKSLRTVIYKITVQMLCKIGGSPWALHFPCQNWMVVGIDVYHSGSGSSKQAVLGFVSSMNRSFTAWHSAVRLQRGEISSFLKLCFVKALDAYRDRWGRFPDKIVVFRDGVGDGQLDHCAAFEVPQLEEVLEQFGLGATITFVVIKKRINTRLFDVDRRDGGFANPRPGTVVDSQITKRYLFDYFLVPQHVNQGTVTPTHYIVLSNKANIKPDNLQRLSFKLCHLYYNWSGTIRVPAPCQYAHKLAYLIGNHVRKEPLEELSNKLYYL